MKTVIKSVKDLKVYQLAYKLAVEIFEITKKFPKEETYSLTSSCCGKRICHSRESGNPAFSLWTPAFAGVTSSIFTFHNRY